MLCGVGILSTPYAAKQGGWLGLSILFLFAMLSFYTGMLLRHCLDSEPGLETYPDIGQAAFGSAGRVAISVSILIFLNLYVICPCKLCHFCTGFVYLFLFPVVADNTLRGIICKYSFLE